MGLLSLFAKRRRRVPLAEYVAELHTDLVTGATAPPLKTAALSPDSPRFVRYKVASVLMVLGPAAERRPRLKPALHAFEQLAFPPEYDTRTLGEIRSAMTDLNALASGAAGKGLYWSQAWFAALGYVVNDPVDLATFAHWWLTRLGVIARVVEEFDPA